MIRLPFSKGCKHCSNTGFEGRIGIFEILEVTPKIHELILKRASAEEIYQSAKSEGFATMFEDGIEKVQRGLTSINEVLRVALPEKIQNLSALSPTFVKTIGSPAPEETKKSKIISPSKQNEKTKLTKPTTKKDQKPA